MNYKLLNSSISDIESPKGLNVNNHRCNLWFNEGLRIFIPLLLFLSFTNKAFSQYTGGRGSGFAMAETVPSSLGIKPITNENGVRLSPNPVVAGQNVNLQFTQALYANTTLIISDITGRVFKNETIPAGTGLYPINTSGIQAGMYIIKIISSEYQIERKLIIL